MGPSGSGKTTLLNCIATIIKPTSGRILLNGKNISAFGSKDLAEYRGSQIWIGNPFLNKFIPNKILLFKHYLCCHFWYCFTSVFYWGHIS